MNGQEWEANLSMGWHSGQSHTSTGMLVFVNHLSMSLSCCQMFGMLNFPLHGVWWGGE